MVHGDVFRPPANASLLCTFLGSGVQILTMVLITIIVAMFGMLSPSSREGLNFKNQFCEYINFEAVDKT